MRPECVVVCSTWSLIQEQVGLFGEWKRHWSSGHSICPDRATEQEEEKKKKKSVCLCATMRTHLCGLMSEDGRVVRYEVSSAQFGCGSEHNESD